MAKKNEQDELWIAIVDAVKAIAVEIIRAVAENNNNNQTKA